MKCIEYEEWREKNKDNRDFLAWIEQGMEVLVPELEGEWGRNRSFREACRRSRISVLHLLSLQCLLDTQGKS